MQKVVVGLFIDTQNGKIALAKRNQGVSFAHHWEFPGGNKETSESAEECLQRQIFDTFNVGCELGGLFCETTYSYEQGKIHFIALLAQFSSLELEPRFHEEIKWVDITDLANYKLVPGQEEIANQLLAFVGAS